MGEKRNFAALEWVTREISDTLREARQALEAYVDDPKDSTRMRFCLTHIHQVHGSLQMVEFHGAALIAEEMEKLAQAVIDDDVSHMPEAQEVLMRSLLQLPIFLDRIKIQKDDSPSSALPLLNDLRAVRKQRYLSETSLFSPDLSALENIRGARHPFSKDPAKLKPVLKKLREMYQFAAASVLRSIKLEENLDYLVKVFSRLEILTTGTAAYPTWNIAHALADGLRRDDIELTVAVRGLMRYLARELRVLSENAPTSFDTPVTESLIKNLLFYVASADDGSELVEAVKTTYSLRNALIACGVHGSSQGDGNILQVQDQSAVRSVVSALQDELANIKHVLGLSLTGNGTPEDITEILPSVKRVADTLAVLGLGDLRKQMIEQSERLEKISASPELDEQELTVAASRIIEVEHRLQAIGKSVGKSTDLSKVDEREVEIDDAKAAVIKECRRGLEQAKESIVEYISSQWDRKYLENIGSLLTDIRGGLEMIPLTRPASIVESCSSFIAHNLLASDARPNWQTLDSLADAMSSVEYYLERITTDINEEAGSILDVAEESILQLGYQVANRDLATDDEAPSEQSVTDKVTESTVVSNVDVSKVEQNLAYSEPSEIAAQDEPEEDDEPIVLEMPQSSFDDETEDETVSDAESNDSYASPETPHQEYVLPEPIQTFDSEPEPEPEPENIPAAPESDIDDEIIEIFIEEAGEVLETLEEFFPLWRANSGDEESMTVVRRSFHTLKGSGRMVEAYDIGELAWSIESMLNRIMDDTVSVMAEHSQLIALVIEFTPTLVTAFENRSPNPEPELCKRYQSWAESLSEGVVPADFGSSTKDTSTAVVEPEDTEVQAQIDDRDDEATLDLTDSFDDGSEEEIELELESIPDSKSGFEIDGEPFTEASVGQLSTGVDSEENDEEDDEEDRILKEIFSSEALYHLHTIESFISAMEEAAPIYGMPSDDLQRALHTLKGSAKMAQVWPIAEMAEPLENFTKELITFQIDINDDILQLTRDIVNYTRIGLEALRKGEDVDIPLVTQFAARTEELRDLAVGAFVSSQSGRNQSGAKVDPRVLTTFLAEGTHWLLDSEILLAKWFELGEPTEDLRALLAELSQLKDCADKANMQHMSALSEVLIRVHKCALASASHRLNQQEFNVLTQGHEALLDMIDAIAAAQHVTPPADAMMAALQTLVNDLQVAEARLPEPVTDEQDLAESEALALQVTQAIDIAEYELAETPAERVDTKSTEQAAPTLSSEAEPLVEVINLDLDTQDEAELVFDEGELTFEEGDLILEEEGLSEGLEIDDEALVDLGEPELLVEPEAHVGTPAQEPELPVDTEVTADTLLEVYDGQVGEVSELSEDDVIDLDDMDEIILAPEDPSAISDEVISFDNTVLDDSVLGDSEIDSSEPIEVSTLDESGEAELDIEFDNDVEIIEFDVEDDTVNVEAQSLSPESETKGEPEIEFIMSTDDDGDIILEFDNDTGEQFDLEDDIELVDGDLQIEDDSEDIPTLEVESDLVEIIDEPVETLTDELLTETDELPTAEVIDSDDQEEPIELLVGDEDDESIELVDDLDEIITLESEDEIELSEEKDEPADLELGDELEDELGNVELVQEETPTLDEPVSTDASTTEQEAPVIESAVPAGSVSILIDNIDVNDPDYDADITEIFLEEADELTEELDEALHTWETEWGNQGAIESMKRALHTLKGGARLSGMQKFGDLTHDYEGFIESVNLKALDAGFFKTLHEYQDKVLSAGRGLKHFVATGEVLYVTAERVDANAESEAPADSAGEHAQSATEASASHTDNVVPFVAKPKPSGSPSDDAGVFGVTEFNAAAAFGGAQGGQAAVAARKGGPQEVVKVSAELLEELVNLAGETSISRSRLEQHVSDFSFSLDEIDSTLSRLQEQLRRLDIETEAQVIFRREQLADDESFDPLEMDRYSQLQQLSRSLTESASDLVDLKSDLGEQLRDTETLLLQQSRINTNLQEGLMRSRMVPFSRLVPRLRRIVRQVAGELGKQVNFELDNIEGELDRSVLERMVPPFEHMLRNAVDHGIEMPEDRMVAGKPKAGCITLTLGREGGDVIIRLKDDGRGIDLKRVRAKAIERELMLPDAELADHDIMQFILHAGFSTAESVTQISGRGVGMDIVNAEIKQLGGAVSIDSEWGKGTEFLIRLPFTLSVNRALMIDVGNDNYAVPLSSIEGIVRISPYELEHYYDSPDARFEYAGEKYHVRYLGGLLNKNITPKLEGKALPLPVILVRSAEHAMALHVDALQGSREIVVKSLGQQFSLVSGLSGATVMGDGSVVVILDPHALVRQEVAGATQLQADQASKGQSAEVAEVAEVIKTIMVVDDSVTVRKVTTRFLEREGYEVITAKDGVDALRVLQEGLPDLMLLDIEMPRMDGFEVAKTIRTTRRWKHLPIIMITSRTGDKHREHALTLGVDKYLGKPYQEDLLLESMEELLEAASSQQD